MGYGLITAGIVFLFLPQFGVYDVMPDLIGYALIMSGLTKLSVMNADLEHSRKNFRYLFFLSLAKTLLLFPLLRIADETTSMLYVFSFAIAETVFLLPAFSSLYEGSFHISSVNGCDIRDKDHADLVLVSRVFIIARAVLACIPELTVLTNNAYKEEISVDDLDKMTLYDSKNVITVACFVLSLVIGAVFLVLAVRYFTKLARDKGSVAAIKARYVEQVSGNEGVGIYKAFKTSSTLFLWSLILLIPLYFYGVDVFFDFIALGFAAASMIFLSKLADTKKTVVLSFVTAAFSAFSTAFEIYTANRFGTLYTVDSYRYYTVSAALRAVVFVCFAVISAQLYGYLRTVVDKYTKAPTFDEAGYKKGLKNKCMACCMCVVAACCVAAVSGFLYMISAYLRVIGALAFIAAAVVYYICSQKLGEELSRRL